mmetsp:Transcript_68064/g.138454  ORF Transcript_68064/g.138454 Transcript_68064/m.138454 type:complete len:378 (+) Transcript_68064:376-1509(+)
MKPVHVLRVVGVVRERPQITARPAHLAVLVPVVAAFLNELLRRAKEPNGALLPPTDQTFMLPDRFGIAAENHANGLSIPRVVVVSGRSELHIWSALRHIGILRQGHGDLGMTEVVGGIPREGCSTGRQSSDAKAARVNRRLVAQAPTAKVCLRPKAVVIAGVIDAVHAEVAIETNHLDDVVEIFDDPAGIQDCRPWLEPLHRTLDDLGTIPIESTEGRVTDAPTSVLLDCRNRTVRIRGDREELPRVPVEEAVHGHEGIEDEGRRRGIATLIDVPRDAPGQEQVEVARDDVHLGTPELHDRPAVLSGESTHADHDAILLIDSPVVELVAEAVPDLPAKNILSWPSLAVRDAQAAGVVAQAGALASACLVGAVGLLQL